MLLLTSICHVSAFSENVNIVDVKGFNDAEYRDDQQLFFGTDWYYKPSSYAELVGWYQSLESLYPEYIELLKINEIYNTGIVDGGYDLYCVRITNESLGFHKPEVLFCGSPHGDETVGTIGMFWFADWLMRMAFTDEPSGNYSKEWLRWLIDNREIYFEISHNPYGFDHGPQRYDYNYWDLNREADYDGPGTPTGGIWGSVNGQTLRAFIDDHMIRAGCDFHGGTRMLLYPWTNHNTVIGQSKVTNVSYYGAPPDFYFYDAAMLRVGDYMGDYGGNLYYGNIGPVYDVLYYIVYGAILCWAYGADVVTNPAEDVYVEDETFGNYPGAGIFWSAPEMSYTKNPLESYFGNDTVEGYGWEVRRFILHQTDIAQPYVRWMPASIENQVEVLPGTEIHLKWQVNGSLVVDHTFVKWGTDPDPVTNWDFQTVDYDDYAGKYLGGTGWDDAMNGETNGVTYDEPIVLNTPGVYYFTACAQVDQSYDTVVGSDVYGNSPYLRIVKERTNDSYYEARQCYDGLEEIQGQTWWHSPIIQITVLDGGEQPYTTMEFNGTLGENGWYVTDGYITLNATSTNYTINTTYYRIDSGDWIAYDNPFLFSEQGEHLIEFYSVDSEGNQEFIKSEILKIDYTTPTVRIIKKKITDGILFSVRLNDDFSGPSHVEFYLDDTLVYTDYNYPFEWSWIGTGKHTLKTIGFDIAGNYVEEITTTTRAGKKET